MRLGLGNDKGLNQVCEEVGMLSRKILLHDIPSLQLTASENGLVALSSPLVSLKYAILVYLKEMTENQWEDYKSIPSDYKVMINPFITKHSDKTDTLEEECSALPSLYFSVERPIAVEVEYKDINFLRKTEQFFGFQARVISHEIDHLNGILPSNLKVCNGKCRQKYSFLHSDRVEKEYEEMCREGLRNLEMLYKEDKKFRDEVDCQSDKKDFFLRIVLGDQKFSEYAAKKTEAFRMDLAGGKYPINTK